MRGAVLGRTLIDREKLPGIAEALARELRPFGPDRVIYLEEGGRAIGLLVAEALGVPAEGIDVRYPLSRRLSRLPRALLPLAWPLKELSYRWLSPRLNRPMPALQASARVALVDDSASTGRSIATAVRALASAGIERDAVRVAVIRRGPRARDIVDCFATTAPVLFGPA